MNVKKIIAREGLILLGFICGSAVIIGLTKLSYHIFYLLTKPRLYDNLLIFEPFNTIKNIGLLIVVFGYFAYLLIRFIIWAIKTLKQKEALQEVDMKKYIIVRTTILVIPLIIISLFFLVRNYTNLKLKQQLEEKIARQSRDETIRKFNEEYQAQEERRLQKELAMQEEQIRLQKAAIAIQMMQSIPQHQYSISPPYQQPVPRQSQQQQKRCYTTCSPSVYHGDGTTSGANCVTQCY